MIVGWKVSVVDQDGDALEKTTWTAWGAYRFAKKKLKDVHSVKADIFMVTLSNGCIFYDSIHRRIA